METIIPGFPCRNLPETLDFYRALGFTVTHEQTKPYLYGAVQRGDIQLHFSRFHKKQSPGSCLVMVPAVRPYYQTFADGLREQYGRIPTVGHPRLTRLWPRQTRFHLFDPTGNILLFIEYNEPEIDYEAHDVPTSPLAQSLDNAIFLRDVYTDDRAAAKVLDKALARYKTADPVERARALAIRAELALALDDAEQSQALRAELQQIPLSPADQERYRHELQAADKLEQWLQ